MKINVHAALFTRTTISPRAKPLEELGEVERGAGPSHELVWLDGVGVRRKRCHDSRPGCRLELGVRVRDAGSDELSASREAPTVAEVLPR